MLNNVGRACVAATAAICRTRQPKSFGQYPVPAASVPVPLPVKAPVAKPRMDTPHCNLVISIQTSGTQAVQPITIPLNNLMPRHVALQDMEEPTSPICPDMEQSEDEQAKVVAATQQSLPAAHWPEPPLPPCASARGAGTLQYSEPQAYSECSEENPAPAAPEAGFISAASALQNGADSELVTPCFQPDAQPALVPDREQ